MGANERADQLRLEVFGVKKRQLDALHVDMVVTACANCRNMLEDGMEHYGINVRVVGLTELIAEYLEVQPRVGSSPR